jgi:phosphate:Na+ symporter
MHQMIIICGMLLGGLGMFLLAVTMITDGLKATAGPALREMLANWTRSPLHGIFSGVAITAIVQSSSAVTVATIGFVNAGIINMRQALGIVYGSNIGTTMTGWLVAIIGFKINVDAFALPLIGLGMILKLTGGESKRASIGLALVGFGLFFTGIDVLKDAFGGLVESIDLARFTIDGFSGVLMYLGIGFLMTLLTQSSSAAIAITLTAASGGVLDINAAAAMVIGANVGTTSTAALAVIGATPNAKRVASAHILFNVGTGLVALIILPVLFLIVKHAGVLLGLADIPAVTLALFHTIFNILGVLLIFPLNSRLADFLEKQFVTQEEKEGQPRYLDKVVAVSPPLAVNALALELARVTAVVRRMDLEALSNKKGSSRRISIDEMVVRKLSASVAEFITQLEREKLSQEVSTELALVLRAEQHLLASADQAALFARLQVDVRPVEDHELLAGIRRFYDGLASLIKLAIPGEADFSYAECERQLGQVQNDYDDLKASLLRAGTASRIPIPQMIDVVEQNSRLRRMARQLVKGMNFLNEVFVATSTILPEAALSEGVGDNSNEQKKPVAE